MESADSVRSGDDMKKNGVGENPPRVSFEELKWPGLSPQPLMIEIVVEFEVVVGIENPDGDGQAKSDVVDPLHDLANTLVEKGGLFANEEGLHFQPGDDVMKDV